MMSDLVEGLLSVDGVEEGPAGQRVHHGGAFVQCLGEDG
ncbi:hypothetical protein SFUMM280S_05870 [Streptomyces fumanus]